MSRPTPGQIEEKREEALELMARLSKLEHWARAHGIPAAEVEFRAASASAAAASSALRRARKEVEE